MLPDLPDEDRPLQIGPVKGLEAFGEYRVEGWVQPKDRADYAYTIMWVHRALKVVATGEPLAIVYYAQRTLRADQQRDSGAREATEAEAWEQLNGLVRQAARGAAYIYAPTLQGLMTKKILELLETWESVPEDSGDQINRAMDAGSAQYDKAVEELGRLGGDPESPRNSSGGWYVAVEPLPGHVGPSYRG